MYVGIDLGSTNCKFVLLDEEGRVQQRYSFLTPTNRQSEYQSEVFVRQLVAQVRLRLQCLLTSSPQPIKSIGITGQMHGLMFVDQKNRPLSDFITWQDIRSTQSLLTDQESAFDFCRKVLLDRGIPIRPGMAIPIYEHLRRLNRLPEGFWQICSLPDFLVCQLTFCANHTDATNAAATGGYDAANQCWFDELPQFGLAGHRLPAVVPSGTAIGHLDQSGPVVIAATGDFQAAAYGSGLRPHELLLNVGTGAQVAVIGSPEVEPGPEYEVRPYYDNQTLICATGLPGGRYIREFLNRPNNDLEDLLKNLAHQYHEAAQNLPGGREITTLRISGGAFDHSALFKQIVDMQFHLPLALPRDSDEAAVGAALLSRNPRPSATHLGSSNLSGQCLVRAVGVSLT